MTWRCGDENAQWPIFSVGKWEIDGFWYVLHDFYVLSMVSVQSKECAIVERCNNFNSFPSKYRLQSFSPLLGEKYLYLVAAFITQVTLKLNQDKHAFSGGAAEKLVLLFSSPVLTFKCCVGIKRPHFLQNKIQLFLMKILQKPFTLAVWTSYTILLYR